MHGEYNTADDIQLELDNILNFAPIDDSWFVSQGFGFDEGMF